MGGEGVKGVKRRVWRKGAMDDGEDDDDVASDIRVK